MRNSYQPARLASVTALALVASVSFVKPSSATGVITKPDLQGPWQITLNGNTGCGLVSMLVNVTLNTVGVGTNATIKTHAITGAPAGCEGTLSGQTFQIVGPLVSNGSGKANLSCGPGCGWNFDIQVSADRSMFNLADVDPANPNNLLAGVAIHQ